MTQTSTSKKELMPDVLWGQDADGATVAIWFDSNEIEAPAALRHLASVVKPTTAKTSVTPVDAQCRKVS